MALRGPLHTLTSLTLKVLMKSVAVSKKKKKNNNNNNQ